MRNTLMALVAVLLLGIGSVVAQTGCNPESIVELRRQGFTPEQVVDFCKVAAAAPKACNVVNIAIGCLESFVTSC